MQGYLFGIYLRSQQKPDSREQEREVARTQEPKPQPEKESENRKNRQNKGKTGNTQAKSLINYSSIIT